MPWATPTLAEIRRRNRDYVTSRMNVALVPNSITRVVVDANGANAHLTLQYLDWLADQLMPDRAETEWMDRQANIWLVNADGSKGRKAPTPASGYATLTGINGTVVPVGTQLRSGALGTATIYQTTADVVIGAGDTPVPMTAIDAGILGNLELGDIIVMLNPVTGVDRNATIVTMTGGTEEETDDELRLRVLERIRRPPMGGDADDYVQWALAYPGVTRAWCSPLEMGIGTTTVRFMMDDLRAAAEGFPNALDVAKVSNYIQTKRPVTALDIFVVAPKREPISFTISNLMSNDASTRAAIEASVRDMIMRKAAPAHARNGVAQDAQTIYAAWVSDAVMDAVGVESFTLGMVDHVMPTKGSLAVLGNVSFT